jgi:hypothetical protein
MEQAMATLTPGQVFLVCIGALLALAGFINTVGAAYDRITKARQAAQAPNKEQDTRLNDLERRMGDVERMLGNDKRSLDKINDGLEASFQVQLALLDHALNGNNIKQMQDARDGLYVYLTHPNKQKE